MSELNPYGIQPLHYETTFPPHEQRKLDLIVEIDDAIRTLDQEKIKELIIRCANVGNGEAMIKKLKGVLV